MDTIAEFQTWKPQFERFPVLSMLFQMLDKMGAQFDISSRQGGVELHFLNQVNGMANRAYLRIYFPVETKCVLFFHKKSSVPFSRDRFSYGGVVIDARSGSRFEEGDVKEWIQFSLSGFQPSSRPNSLKKSFPYTIPED